MPIIRVPVVHKFGIVSVSRAEQLLREGRGDRKSGTHARHPRLEVGRGWKRVHESTYAFTCRPAKATAPTKISQTFITKVSHTVTHLDIYTCNDVVFCVLWYTGQYNATPEVERGRLDKVIQRTFSQAKVQIEIIHTVHTQTCKWHTCACACTCTCTP